ncbi:MAG: hypothetical protein CL537_00080 [Alcanivoracaceae bacterium]|nr:hypothetical protein [Alcanivoracaceae bacterium]
MVKVLVTGGTGFVGRALARELLASAVDVAVTTSQSTPSEPQGYHCHAGFPLSIDTDWGAALEGISVVVHCAARVHVMRDEAEDPLAAFRSTNVAGTLTLARQAAASGVKRFVFISSIKALGEATPSGAPFHAGQALAPEDPYGVSKAEAEVALRELCEDTGMELVIIRPVLVYGPGVKGNFAMLIRLVQKGLPLPLGSIDNRRSMVALNNLVDLIRVTLDHPNAVGKAFLVSDGEDLSTTALLKRLAIAMNKRPLLLPVPPGWLAAAARLLGRQDQAQRILGNLQVDISFTRSQLNWEPKVSVEDALAELVRD